MCYIIWSKLFFVIITKKFIIYLKVEVNKDNLSISIETPFMALFLMFFGTQIITAFLGLKFILCKAILVIMLIMNYIVKPFLNKY